MQVTIGRHRTLTITLQQRTAADRQQETSPPAPGGPGDHAHRRSDDFVKDPTLGWRYLFDGYLVK
jgi:hypothetical protein